TVRSVREILESSGASTATVTIDRSYPTRSQTNLNTVLPKVRALHPDLPADATALLGAITLVLTKGGSTDLQPLEDARLLRSEGDFTRPADYVIIVGGASLENESRAETLDVPLIRGLRDKGMTVLCTEPEAAAISYVPLLKDI